jgi:hypothetical protein
MDRVRTAMLCSGCFGSGDVIATRVIVALVFRSPDASSRFFLHSFSDLRASDVVLPHEGDTTVGGGCTIRRAAARLSLHTFS